MDPNTAHIFEYQSNKEARVQLAFWVKYFKNKEYVPKEEDSAILRKRIEEVDHYDGNFKCAQDKLEKFKAKLREKNKNPPKLTENCEFTELKECVAKYPQKFLDMKPVKQEEKIGFCEGKQGRLNYLKRRSEKYIPEERYYHKLCSSWEYGWKLGDTKSYDDEGPLGIPHMIQNTFFTGPHQGIHGLDENNYETNYKNSIWTFDVKKDQ